MSPSISLFYSLNVPFYSLLSPEASAIRSGVRKKEVVRARKILCQIAVRRLGYPGAEVARFLEISTSAVNCLASQKELTETGRYLE